MNPATKTLPRTQVEVLGRSDLLDDALAQDGDPVAEGHGLGLVVRDIDGRRVQPALQVGDLTAHLDPQLGVEVGERLVEQERGGLAHDGTSHGDALALAA